MNLTIIIIGQCLNLNFASYYEKVDQLDHQKLGNKSSEIDMSKSLIMILVALTIASFIVTSVAGEECTEQGFYCTEPDQCCSGLFCHKDFKYCKPLSEKKY